jgi:hypothetical protein
MGIKESAAEYVFRYHERPAVGIDHAERTVYAVKSALGVRLTYNEPHAAQG